MAAEEVATLRYGPPLSPHLAAALAGRPIDTRALVEHATSARSSDTLIVEGVGGLLVPLTNDFTVRDLAVELALPLLIVASPGLGTINHTLLTIEAARAAGLIVAAVVLTPWPTEPSLMEQSNRETIARLGAIEVATLDEIASPSIADLARAGERVPWRDWLTR
jgi:dethiobiotin synthetase